MPLTVSVLLTAGLVLPAAAAASTASAEQVRAPAEFAVQGKRVRGAAAPDGAPRLEPGQYADQFGRDGADLYYTVARSHTDSTLYVGLSGRPKSASSDRESVVLRLLTTDGLDCGYGETFDNDFQVKRRNSVESATAVSWSPAAEIRKRCLRDSELILRVSPDPDAARLTGSPFELTVTEEPPAATAELPPAAGEPDDWTGMPPVSRATNVTGGTSFNQARDLRTGSYQSEIQPGEARLFKVPVGWGQTLQATARVQKPSAAFQRELDPLEQTITLRLYGPTRGFASADSTTAPGQVGDVISFTQDTLLSAMTLPVRYNNRSGEDPEQQAASLAGDYYVMVTLSEDKQRQAYRLPYELTIKVAGRPDAAPAYPAGQKVVGPGASQLAMTDLPSATEQTDDDAGAGTIGLLAIAGAVLLLSGLATLIITRARSRRRPEYEDSVVSESS
ncbi:hypothetical protein [Flindersiella endophytica]